VRKSLSVPFFVVCSKSSSHSSSSFSNLLDWSCNLCM